MSVRVTLSPPLRKSCAPSDPSRAQLALLRNSPVGLGGPRHNERASHGVLREDCQRELC
jgi:hypothetical protein